MTPAASTVRLKRNPDGAVFARRRRRLMRRMGRGSVALLPAAPRTFHSNDVEHRYRPDSDLYYLTGLAEPRALAVLAPGQARGSYWLLVRPRDAQREVWTGPRAGLEGARATHGADRAFASE
jgi:Xaa-Pro aminopeptidase